MRPVFNGTALDMPAIIEILMLCAAAVILLISRTDGIKATQGSVFPAGMQAVIAIFGIAWMGDTFINGNITELTGSIEGDCAPNALVVRSGIVCHVHFAL